MVALTFQKFGLVEIPLSRFHITLVVAGIASVAVSLYMVGLEPNCFSEIFHCSIEIATVNARTASVVVGLRKVRLNSYRLSEILYSSIEVAFFAWAMPRLI